jgi:hypothetical protein
MHNAILISGTILLLAGMAATAASYFAPKILADFERAEREENE